jgi:hypothetical protein
MATVQQKLIRDFTMLLQTRGTRLTAHSGDTFGGVTTTDAFKLYTTDLPGFDASDTDKVYMVIEFDKAQLTALSDDKAFGAEGLIIPDPDRV